MPTISALSQMNCPLCNSTDISDFHKDRFRPYLRCTTCHLVFVPPKTLPTPEEEKGRYLEHENTPENEGYVRFLQQFIDPLKKRISPEAKGLDYGSGPTPVLAQLMLQQGFEVQTYDPFFADNRSLLESNYDFLTCIETAEHFHHPRKEWDLINQLVKPGGWIGIRTEMIHEDTKLDNWYYMRDFTHVCFYSENTFEWIADNYGFEVAFEGRALIYLQKRGKEKYSP